MVLPSFLHALEGLVVPKQINEYLRVNRACPKLASTNYSLTLHKAQSMVLVDYQHFGASSKLPELLYD